VSYLCTPTNKYPAVSAATAKTYITGISHTHACLGLTLHTQQFRLLKQTLTGAERQGAAASRPTRIPVTVTDIQAAAPFLPRNYNGVMILAAMYLASCGLLRISELFGQSQSRSGTSRALLVNQLLPHASPSPHYVLTLRHHKTVVLLLLVRIFVAHMGHQHSSSEAQWQAFTTAYKQINSGFSQREGSYHLMVIREVVYYTHVDNRCK
jgi:hypothetical protein